MAKVVQEISDMGASDFINQWTIKESAHFFFEIFFSGYVNQKKMNVSEIQNLQSILLVKWGRRNVRMRFSGRGKWRIYKEEDAEGIEKQEQNDTCYKMMMCRFSNSEKDGYVATSGNEIRYVDFTPSICN